MLLKKFLTEIHSRTMSRLERVNHRFKITVGSHLRSHPDGHRLKEQDVHIEFISRSLQVRQQKATACEKTYVKEYD